MIRDHGDHDPSMKPGRQSATRLTTEVAFRAHQEHFRLKNNTFRASAIIPNFAKCCPCPRKVTLDSLIILVLTILLLTQNDSHAWSSLHTKRHSQCAERQVSPLPRKMTRMLDPPHIWLVIYTVRSNGCHPPTSPNTAPAKKFQQNLLENRWKFTCKAGMIRAWSETIASMIRAWNRQSATRLATEVIFRAHQEHFLVKYNILRPGYHSKFHQMLPCHVKWDLARLFLGDSSTGRFYYLSRFYYWTILELNDSITWRLYYWDDSITWRFYYLTILFFALQCFSYIGVSHLNFLWHRMECGNHVPRWCRASAIHGHKG